MAVAASSIAGAPRNPHWIVRLRWGLWGVGGLGCAAAVLVTPELIARALRAGAPLTAIGVETLLVYRALAGIAGASLLAFAIVLPRIALDSEALLGPICELPVFFVLRACVALKPAFGPKHTIYTTLVRGDGVVEYATAVAYLAAGPVAAGGGARSAAPGRAPACGSLGRAGDRMFKVR